MDQRTGDDTPVTRLGPASGGRPPAGPGEFRVYGWQWGPDEARRPGMPWIGVFLLVFGALLLVQQLVPDARAFGSLFVFAVGLAFLVKWVLDRGTASLYAGAIITALAVPGLIEAATDTVYDGLGTLSLGAALLFIAAVRLAGGGGWGWQAWFGGLLALIGGAGLLTPGVGGLIVPALIVVLGLAMILRGTAWR